MAPSAELLGQTQPPPSCVTQVARLTSASPWRIPGFSLAVRERLADSFRRVHARPRQPAALARARGAAPGAQGLRPPGPAPEPAPARGLQGPDPRPALA